MIHHRHSLRPIGLRPLSFFFHGTSLHVRRVDMWSCWMVSVARPLARVAILSASFCEWVSYDFEQIISLQVSMSICVSLPDPNEFLVLDAISSWLMFLKMTLSALVSGLSVMADYFSSAACGCFSFCFFMMSVVMSCFLSMLLALSTNLRAFFTCPCSISLHVPNTCWITSFLNLLLSVYNIVSSTSFVMPCTLQDTHATVVVHHGSPIACPPTNEFCAYDLTNVCVVCTFVYICYYCTLA